MPAPPAALTSGEKAALKKIKAKENKAKANPKRAEENKASADAKRAVGGFSAIQKQDRGQTDLLLSLIVSMLHRVFALLCGRDNTAVAGFAL
ncbi:hypothetical protein WJX77_005485 [Trebouxia sp. C0004]